LSPGACAVGSSLAARLHLHPGDSLQVQHVADGGGAAPTIPYRLATILTTGASEDDQVFLPLATVQGLLGMTGKVTLVEISIPGETHDVERAIRQLAGLLPGLEVRPIRQIVYSEGKVLGTIRWLLLSLTVLILVIIALCVMATMTAIVMERRKDIGVMKALGAADSLLMRLFITEGAGLGLVGGVLGYALGTVLAHTVALRLFGVSLSLNAWSLPLICGLTVALAVVAAQVPVRIVRTIQPTVVLKGE
jgi:putative ABC transport system permease protein